MEEEIELNKSFKKKWIKALISGDYKQGKEDLYDPVTKTYCCIGVAGSICGISNRSLSKKAYFEEGQFSKSTLSSYKKKGLDPLLMGEHKGIIQSLVIMNDHKDNNFHEIANFIKDNL